MRVKYCTKIHLISKIFHNGDSRTWRYMLSICDKVEQVLHRKVVVGIVNF